VRFRREHRGADVSASVATAKRAAPTRESTRQRLLIRRTRAARRDVHGDVVASLLWAFWLLPVGGGAMVMAGLPAEVLFPCLVGAYAAATVAIYVVQAITLRREAPVSVDRDQPRFGTRARHTKRPNQRT
jgi:hypothetical protein